MVSGGTQRLSRSEQALLARTIVRLLEKWSASDGQARAALGGVSPAEYSNWKHGRISRLTPGQIYRLALLLQIHVALRVRFISTSQAFGWMNRPNATFGGMSPLNLIASGECGAIERVLSYLASEMSPW